MFSNVILDVFIGLVFVYLLYSLLATIIQELIANRMNLRARMLQKAVRKMLEDHAAPTGNWLQRSTLYNYFGEIAENIRRFFVPFRPHESLAKKFYDHPAVKYLGEDKAFSKPAYLQPHNFAYTLIQLLRGPSYNGSTIKEAELIRNALENNTLNVTPETLSHLRNLFADAQQDAYQFRKRLEQWFDETMQRTNGWYKQQNQTFLIIIGFLIAIIFNVDTIAITRILSKDRKVREQMVQLALSRKDAYGEIIDSVKVKRSRVVSDTSAAGRISTRTVAADTTIYMQNDKYFTTVYKQLADDAQFSQSIIGLRCPDSVMMAGDCGSRIRKIDSLLAAVNDPSLKQDLSESRQSIVEDCRKDCRNPYQQSVPLKVAGWIITALAISLGAPFWFDLLNKVAQLRSTGTRVPTGIAGNAEQGPSGIHGTTSDGRKIRG
jgi:hypothetical protein